MRYTHFITAIALVAGVALSGCVNEEQAANGTSSSGGSQVASLNLPSGSSIDITLGTSLTSETASVGTSWSGTVRNAVDRDGHSIIPAGSPVSGTVTGVTAARKGDRAMLDLGLSSVTVNGRSYNVHGTTESVIAGSTRARNLGVIGAATAAGAVVGHAIGGTGKGTIIGAVTGAGVGTGVVSQTKGWQVVLKPGTEITFTTNEAVAVRL